MYIYIIIELRESERERERGEFGLVRWEEVGFNDIYGTCNLA